jgi:prolyl oligopeptidase
VAQGGKPVAINFFLASPDGAKVAVGISSGGSEDASITVTDADAKAQIAGPVDRAEYGATAWSDDGTTLHIVRLKPPALSAAETEKYEDLTLVSWILHDEPVPIVGSTVDHGPRFSPIEVPNLELCPGGTMAAEARTCSPAPLIWSPRRTNCGRSFPPTGRRTSRNSAL